MGKTKKNLFLQVTYQIFGIMVPFITAPYVLGVLGAEQVGIYSYTHSIVNYFMCFSLLGLEFYGNRSIARVRNNRDDTNRVFTEIFCSHLISSLISIIVYLIYCFSMTGIYRIIAVIQLLYLIGETLNVNWFFAGIGEFKVTILRHIFVKILNVTLIFTLVNSEDDLLIYIFIMALCTCTSMCSVWIVLWKYVKFVKVKISDVIKHFKPLGVLFVSVLAINLNQMLDKTMLGIFGEFYMLGCYEYADKFINIPITLVTGVGTVMLSKTSGADVTESKEKTKVLLYRILEYITLFSSLIIFGILLYRTIFVELYFGKQFDDVAVLFGFLAVSFLFIAWNSVLRTQYFIPQNLEKYYLISVWIGTGVNIVLNIILIPLYSAFGAAIATDISYMITIFAQLFFICKKLSFWDISKRCLPLVFLGGIPFIIMFPVYKYMPTGWISFGIQILLFCLIFGVASVLYYKFIKKNK